MDASPPFFRQSKRSLTAIDRSQPVASLRNQWLGEVRPEIPCYMPKSDQVLCFYADQDDSWETPVQIVSRADARGMKALKMGAFENHGRTFRLTKAFAVIVKAFVDGPFGIGNLIPFARTQNKLMAPEHLHYSVPACADRGAHYGYNMSAVDTNKPLPLFFPLPLMAQAFS